MNFSDKERRDISVILLKSHSPEFVAGFIKGAEVAFEMNDNKLKVRNIE